MSRAQERVTQYRTLEAEAAKAGRAVDRTKVLVSSKSLEPHLDDLTRESAALQQQARQAERARELTQQYKAKLAADGRSSMSLDDFLRKNGVAREAGGMQRALGAVARSRVGQVAAVVGSGAAKGLVGVGKAYKGLYVDAPMKLINAASPRAAAAARRVGQKVASAGATGLKAGMSGVARATPLMWVAQAGVSFHSYKESQKQEHQLEEALANGQTDKAKELLKKLDYKLADYVLGKGGTQGMLDLAQLAGRSLVDSTAQCAGDVASFSKDRHVGHCLARAALLPGKVLHAVGKGVVKLGAAAVKGIAGGVSKCARAGASQCASNVGSSIASGYHFVKGAVGKWFQVTKLVP